MYVMYVYETLPQYSVFEDTGGMLIHSGTQQHTHGTLHNSLPSFLDGVPAHQWIQHGVNGLTHVLNQDAVTVGQCPLDCIQVTTNDTRHHHSTAGVDAVLVYLVHAW